MIIMSAPSQIRVYSKTMSSVHAKSAVNFSRILSWAFFLILAAFFIGCDNRQLIEPTPQMTLARQFWIKVLLSDDITSCRVTVPSSFRIVDEKSQATLIRINKANVPITVSLKQGQFAIGSRVLASSEISILPDKPFVFSLNKHPYRGNLKLVINSKITAFDAVNVLPPEPYLAGVVGAEMPNYWEKQALKAQAVAARTYCMFIKEKFGTKRHWDVNRTQSSQVYEGIKAESKQVWDAVGQTTGMVLVTMLGDGKDGIFPAYYCSSCGGHTEDSKNVFGDSFAPLRGVECPYCKDIAKTSIFFWPTVQFGSNYITETIVKKYPKLKTLGKIKTIEPARVSNYGKFSRVTMVKLIGQTGKSDFVRGEDFRLSLDPTGKKLKSSIYTMINLNGKWSFIAGRGWGHGVGMCQCGAEGMARRGKDAFEILAYYYPGSKIARIY